jgi:hypothetical protein
MPVYYIKDKLTAKPWSEERTSLHKQDLKGERDRLNNQFCGEKKVFRYVIGTMR